MDGLVAGNTSISGSPGSKKALNVTMGAAGKVTKVESLSTGKLRVTVASGASIDADQVIFSVPLGVLKAKAVSFNPALPQAKLNAIENIGFGNVVKIGLLFDTQFWPQAQHYFSLAQPENSTPSLATAERFSYFLNLVPAVNRPILFTFVFGSQATPVESWTDEEVWNGKPGMAGVRANLVQLFGKDAVPPTYKAMWRSAWATSPNFGGAYSYSATTTNKCDFDTVAAAELSGRLHFAGEHTFSSARGTVHGAFLSGLRAAREVLLWPPPISLVPLV